MTTKYVVAVEFHADADDESDLRDALGIDLQGLAHDFGVLTVRASELEGSPPPVFYKFEVWPEG